MPNPNLTCPDCGAPKTYGARRCKLCNRPYQRRQSVAYRAPTAARNREIILRFAGGETLAELAEAYGLSRSYIGKIVARGR